MAVKRPGCALLLGGRSAPEWPVATVRPGNFLFLGILQHQLQPSPDPLSCNSSRATASAPRWHIDQHPTASEGWHIQRGQWWDTLGAEHTIQLCEVAEGHVPASQGLTNCGPLEKWMATTSVFLLWELHEQYEKAERYATERWAPQVVRCPVCYWEWRGWAKAEMTLSCGCTWWWK